jgi:sarcosine oxidase, subunit gamma
MSEHLTRAEPVPTEAFIGKDVSVRLAAPMARYSLRARQPQALETVLGVKVPKKIGATEGGIACLGPDEWLLRGDIGSKLPTGSGLAIALVDISERAVCLVVEGPRCAEILNAGCPLYLENFAVGRATRTVFETVEIVLIRTGEDQFHVEVWRSFASWLWTALTTAAQH